MPSAEKVSWARLRVGITAIAALFLLFLLVFLLMGNRKFFGQDVTLYTYMPDSASMMKGAPVRLNGILIGKMVNVALSGETDPLRIVKLTMEVPKDMLPQIPDDSTASVGAENLLGAKFLNIQKGVKTSTIKEGGVLKSRDTREFQDLVNAAYPAMESLSSIIKRLDAIVGLVEAGKGSIGKLLVDDELYQNATRLVREIDKIVEAVGSGKGTVGKLLYDEGLYAEVESGVKDLRGSIANVDKLIAGLQDGQGTAGKFLKDPALYDDMRKILADARPLLTELNEGKGTAGKLLKSDELHAKLSQLITRMDTMTAKINAGEGTLGQLLVNPSLYESINGTSKEINGLMKDFRANPKKFLTIQLKLF